MSRFWGKIFLKWTLPETNLRHFDDTYTETQLPSDCGLFLLLEAKATGLNRFNCGTSRTEPSHSSVFNRFYEKFFETGSSFSQFRAV